MNLFEGRNVQPQQFEPFDIAQAVLQEREECARYAELLAEGWKARGRLAIFEDREEARASMCALTLLAAALRNRK
jgi:hypothetical protein